LTVGELMPDAMYQNRQRVISIRPEKFLTLDVGAKGGGELTQCDAAKALAEDQRTAWSAFCADTELEEN